MDSNFNSEGFLQRFKVPIALSLVGVVLIIGGIITSGLTKTKPKEYPKESLIQGSQTSVDVSGAVKKPGVYKISGEVRIEDAIKAAGGFSEDANGDYISKYINLAQKLSDGAKIYVPKTGEQISAGTTSSVAGTSVAAKVNINNASQVELEALPGIGPVTASKIISDRPYGSVDELLSKKVVSKSVFEKIKDQIVIY